jgi:hypothetical protein
MRTLAYMARRDEDVALRGPRTGVVGDRVPAIRGMLHEPDVRKLLRDRRNVPSRRVVNDDDFRFPRKTTDEMVEAVFDEHRVPEHRNDDADHG